MPQAKQRWVQLDMVRQAALIGVPFRFPSRFPMNTVTALRMTLQVEDRAKLALALFKAYWAEDRDINDPTELTKIASSAGFDGQRLVDGANDPAVKDLLRAQTEASVAAGVCGAPSYVVDDGENPPMLFWGQDRMPLVRRALTGWRPKCG
jgi:2-hydroxychromene-2-carboxylate isomerase